MVKASRAALAVCVLVALAGSAAAVGGVPLDAGAPSAAPAAAPSAPAPARSLDAPAKAQAADGADGLPGGCTGSVTAGYTCAFTGTTPGYPIPANPVIGPQGGDIVAYTLPLPKNTTLSATATGAAADGVFIALEAGNGRFAATPAGSALTFIRQGTDAATVSLVVARTGGSGGDWAVDVTVEPVVPQAASGAFQAAASGPAEDAPLPEQVPRDAQCLEGWCLFPATRTSATDVTFGPVLKSGTKVALDVTRTGGSGTATVAVLDATGREVAATTLAADSTDTLTFTTTTGFGSFFVRYATDVADAGSFSGTGAITLPPPPPPPPKPKPVVTGNETGNATGNATGNVTDKTGSKGEDLDPAAKSNDPATPRGLSRIDVAIAATPFGPYMTLGYFSSAILLGLLGVVVVAIVMRNK